VPGKRREGAWAEKRRYSVELYFEILSVHYTIKPRFGNGILLPPSGKKRRRETFDQEKLG
jgi:hypothetical protein